MLPTRSSGVLTAPLGDLTVLYDLPTETVHVLNPAAGLVWECCDGSWTQEDLTAGLVELRDGVSDDVVRAELDGCLATLRAAGVVGRSAPWVPPVPPDSGDDLVSRAFRSRVFAVLDEGVVIASEDEGVVTAIDDLLASQVDLRLATVVLGADVRVDGSILLRGLGPPEQFAALPYLLEPLPTVLNRIAATSATCLALHAGCVRSPTGEVVVIPAVSGSGKTTLTAALVQAGWDYGSDEASGIRADGLDVITYPKPLVLDARSRALLGLSPSRSANVAPTELNADVQSVRGSLGRLDRIILPRYEPGAAVELEAPLEPRDALLAVLEHALNLRFVGAPGLLALTEMADQVPVQRLVHGDAAAAARMLSTPR